MTQCIHSDFPNQMVPGHMGIKPPLRVLKFTAMAIDAWIWRMDDPLYKACQTGKTKYFVSPNEYFIYGYPLIIKVLVALP